MAVRLPLWSSVTSTLPPQLCFMAEGNHSCRSSMTRHTIQAGSMVRLKKPTASGTCTVFIDAIDGSLVRYSYGLGLTSEGICNVSNIQGLENNDAP